MKSGEARKLSLFSVCENGRHSEFALSYGPLLAGVPISYQRHVRTGIRLTDSLIDWLVHPNSK